MLCYTSFRSESGSIPHLIRAGQLQFKTEKLLYRSHGDSAGAADEPLHQILIGRETTSVTPWFEERGFIFDKIPKTKLKTNAPWQCSPPTAPCCVGSPDRWRSEDRSCGSRHRRRHHLRRLRRRRRRPRRQAAQAFDTSGFLLGSETEVYTQGV